MCRVMSDVIWYMYIRLFIANDVFVVISLPKSFIYCLPIILFYPTYIFYGGYGFSVGAIPFGCPSSILFWSTVWGIVFILGRPRGSPLRDSLYFGWRLGVAIMGFVSINVLMLTICFNHFPGIVHYHYPIFNMPKYACPVMATNGSEIQSWLYIITSFQAYTGAMMFGRVIGL